MTAATIDTPKVLKALETFHGAGEQWLEWSCIFRNYWSVLDPAILTNIADVATNRVQVAMSAFSVHNQARSQNVMALLASVCTSKA